MGAYIVRRLLLMIPTVFGIMAISFLITQFAPGGPVEQALANLSGQNQSITERITGSEAGDFAGQPGQGGGSAYRGSQGLSPELVARIEKQFGFDKPPLERFFTMLWNYMRFDFGTSYYRDISVIDMIKEKMPVSISLGLWMTLIAYGVSIPLGIQGACSDGSRFDVWTSTIVIIGYAIPGFLIAILLVVLFAGGSFWSIFPLRGLVSPGFSSFPWYGRSSTICGTWCCRSPPWRLGASPRRPCSPRTRSSTRSASSTSPPPAPRADENQVLYRHVFRNAMMLIIASFPAAFIAAFFGGSLLIETIFSLDGLGLLGFQSISNRDYPVVFATLYIFSLLGLVIGLISDLMYMWIDPRLDFESREI
jgi:microcin C transport system permease protein